jgi:hypothetical protein
VKTLPVSPGEKFRTPSTFHAGEKGIFLFRSLGRRKVDGSNMAVFGLIFLAAAVAIGFWLLHSWVVNRIAEGVGYLFSPRGRI